MRNDIEKIIAEVNSSMAIEGMHLSEEDKVWIRRILLDPSLSNQLISELINKHTVTCNDDNITKKV